MGERKFECVKHLARSGVVREFFEALILAVAVGQIADERESEVLKMDSDLVRSTRVKNRLDEGRRVQPLEHTVRGSRGSTHVFVHGHAFAMRGMARNCGANFATVPLYLAANDCLISLIDASTRELSGQGQMRIVILCDNQTAARVLIEPVHDAGSRHATNAAELSAAMMEKRVYKRVLLVPSCGMHDQASGLIQDQKGVVFVQNIERYFFRLGLRRARVGPMHFHFFARAWRMGWLDSMAIDADVAFFDQSLYRAARNGREFGPQECIQPLGRECSIENQDFSAGVHCCQKSLAQRRKETKTQARITSPGTTQGFWCCARFST